MRSMSAIYGDSVSLHIIPYHEAPTMPPPSDLRPVYFYGPQQEGTGHLSQWYWSPFDDADGTRYTTAEMYMMVQKARLFNDAETGAQMVATTEPRAHKALGRAVEGFDAAVWDERACVLSCLVLSCLALSCSVLSLHAASTLLHVERNGVK
jgi:hypothetical protein